MAVQCSVRIAGDYAMVQASETSLQNLRFDISKPSCRVYENTRQQSREYLEEIVKWCGEQPMNADTLFRSLMMHLSVRRREMGLLA